MAKIVTVHGTFAHIETVSDAAEMEGDSAKQWWQPGSAFEGRLRNLVDGDGTSGPLGNGVEFKPFVWSGNNSERARRKAGARLLSELKSLEANDEKYCVIGHSHGGSVISAALLEAAARRVKLDGLKRWITIGTPFVELRRECFLFLRLPLILKAIFVASLMLLFMFLFNVVGELLFGQRVLSNERQVTRLIVSTILTALPFIVFYVIARLLDRRRLFFYRPRNRRRAMQRFGDRWLALTHEDDEAVRGLGSLGSMRLKIFHETFAVPVLSLLSVFILPLAYLYVVTSPALMVGTASYLKSSVYKTTEYAGEDRGVQGMLKEVRQATRRVRGLRKQLDENEANVTRRLELESELRKARGERRALRRAMMQKYPDLAEIRRAQRFERRFLRKDGALCNGGKLCGNGEDILLNSKLLFHLVTDEVAGAVIDREIGGGLWWRIARSAIPVLLVPVVFGVVAVVLLLLVQFIAGLFSRFVSGWLDRQTWFEIRRTALGNDTEAEVAVGTAPSPAWIKHSCRFLPLAVSNPVSDHSNKAMAASIVKIRNAISEFTLNEGRDGQIGAALNYLTWQELIHTSYFEVEEFRKLVARAVSGADGFVPSAAFKADGEFADSKAWLEAIEPATAQAESGEGD